MAFSALAQLTLDLGKATFDNVFFSVTALQTIVEDRVSALARDACAPSCPLPGLVDECIGWLRRTRTDFKETVDRCAVLTSSLWAAPPRQIRSAPVTDLR